MKSAIESEAKVQRRRQQARWVFALGLGLGAAAFKAYAVKTGLNAHSDFDELWIGARALAAGESPYAAVERDGGRWPLFYPVYAVAAHMPFIGFDLANARLAYIGLSAFAFGLAITQKNWDRWPAVLSAAFLVAIMNGQWSPLLVAGLAYPRLTFLLLSKPTTGGALVLSYYPQLARRRSFWIGVSVAAALAVMGTIIDPRWLTEWLATMHNKPQVRAPAMYAPVIGSMVILLALLRWRRPEARSIALLAAMPQSFRVYELLPLFLVPATRTQSVVLAIGTWLSEAIGGFVSDFPNAVAYQERHAPWYLLFVYAPCAVMVLLRPNVGELPPMVERVAQRLLRRLRGESANA